MNVDDLVRVSVTEITHGSIIEKSEVVGTALHAFTMPFIRYYLGDVVTKGTESCSCGEPYSVLSGIQGRLTDVFPLPGGRIVNPWEITYPFENNTPWLRQFEIVQEREDKIVLRMVPGYTPPEQDLKDIEIKTQKTLGPDVELAIELVDEIQQGPGGKFNVRRSLVHSDYDSLKLE